MGFTLVVVPVLLEMTPLSTPAVIVKVYALLGVIPLGVVVVVVLLLPQAGVRKSAPLMTNRATNPQALRDFLPPTAAPIPANPNMGMVSHRAGNSRGCARAPVVTGPKVLMVTVEVTDAVDGQTRHSGWIRERTHGRNGD